MDTVDTLMASTMNSPVEEVEIQYPIRVERYELWDATPAPGRGGCGPVRENRFDGLARGRPLLRPAARDPRGSDRFPGAVTLVSADGRETALSKFSGFKMGAGEAIRFEGPMGGGYGDPLDRYSALVLADVADSYVTAEQARERYSVVITDGGRAVVERATEELRRSRRE